MMFDEGDYYSPSEMFSSSSSSTTTTTQGMMNSLSKKATKMNMMMMNKKRFSDEQVRSLETIFENETKLEPKKKVQLARELGLQPRQIAIWFQNKRARYKSKQLERDYNILSANYDALSTKFDHLLKEKQSLLLQVEKLKDLVKKGGEDHNQCGNNNNNNESGVTNSDQESRSEIDKDENNSNRNNKSNSDDNNTTHSIEAKPTLSMDNGSEYGASILSSSDEGSSENNTNYFGMEEETDLLTMVQPIVGNSPLTSTQDWGDLHPNCLFDQHNVDNCQWLDFWA